MKPVFDLLLVSQAHRQGTEGAPAQKFRERNVIFKTTSTLLKVYDLAFYFQIILVIFITYTDKET